LAQGRAIVPTFNFYLLSINYISCRGNYPFRKGTKTYRMKLQTLTVALLISIVSFTQDLTGTWEGASPGLGCRYAKLVIIKCGDQYIGYTYDSDPGFCQAHFAGTFNAEKSRLQGKNDGMIRQSFGHTQSRYNLKYKRLTNGIHTLEGAVHPKSGLLTGLSLGIGSRVEYKRTSTEVDTTDYMRRCLANPILNAPGNEDNAADSAMVQAPVVEPPPVSMSRIDSAIFVTIKSRRQNDTISTIYTNQPVIRVQLFDNGQIDGDTVTILHNNSIVSSRLGVTGNPYKFEIAIDPGHPRHEVVLIAHNLGSIPPNTAVVIIEAGDKTYRLTASTDLNKNSVIIFEYRE
jgi:hypothetical protein